MVKKHQKDQRRAAAPPGQGDGGRGAVPCRCLCCCSGGGGRGGGGAPPAPPPPPGQPEGWPAHTLEFGGVGHVGDDARCEFFDQAVAAGAGGCPPRSRMTSVSPPPRCIGGYPPPTADHRRLTCNLFRELAPTWTPEYHCTAAAQCRSVKVVLMPGRQLSSFRQCAVTSGVTLGRARASCSRF
jgi:hypothetical protein